MTSPKQPRHKLYWLPNALTIGRILLIPILMWAILCVGNDIDHIMNAPVFLIILFAVCAFTDFLDGYFARKWDLVSDFGRMIDPIADKLLVAGCLIALVISFGPVWYVVIPSTAIIFRDIFISGTREHAANAGIILSPTKLAKWKTAAEMLAIFALLIGISTRSILPILENITTTSAIAIKTGLILLGIAALLSVYTGLHYVKETFKK